MILLRPPKIWLGRGPTLMLLEREVEDEFRPLMLEALQQGKIDALAAAGSSTPPDCLACGRAMGRHDCPSVSWLTRFGRVGRVRPCGPLPLSL